MLFAVPALLCALLGGADPKALLDPEEALTKHQFLFIVGSYHGGTQFIKELLARHSDVSTQYMGSGRSNEGQYVQMIYPVCLCCYRVVCADSHRILMFLVRGITSRQILDHTSMSSAMRLVLGTATSSSPSGRGTGTCPGTS